MRKSIIIFFFIRVSSLRPHIFSTSRYTLLEIRFFQLVLRIANITSLVRHRSDLAPKYFYSPPTVCTHKIVNRECKNKNKIVSILLQHLYLLQKKLCTLDNAYFVNFYKKLCSKVYTQLKYIWLYFIFHLRRSTVYVLQGHWI